MPLTLIITGMHRSGTSLLASYLQAIGVNVGEKLFQADSFNKKGYFEDIDFLEFQRSVLQSSCQSQEPGWHDWGWTESEQLNRHKFQDYIKTAQDIINSRIDSDYSIWGWKDPRTSLMLNFWHQLIPEAYYLFVYRLPWDVVDSIIRLNSSVFLNRPNYALKIWAFYNRHLLDFYAQHADRCVLININKFINSPDQLIELLKTKFGFNAIEDFEQNKFGEIYDRQMFGCLDLQHPTVQLLSQIAPQYFSLLSELDRVADLPSDFSSSFSKCNSLTSEGLLLSLHAQVVEAKNQIQSYHNQSQNSQLELQSEINRLQAEISAIKESKFWKIYGELTNLKKFIPSKTK